MYLTKMRSLLYQLTLVTIIRPWQHIDLDLQLNSSHSHHFISSCNIVPLSLSHYYHLLVIDTRTSD